MTDTRHRRLRDLFDEAIRQPPAARKEFIRRAASPDAELVRELQSLVDSHRENDVFLEPDTAGRDALVDALAAGPLEPGEHLAHYVVEHEIGRGGMGVVYLAEDTRLARPVALKALNPRLLADPRQIDRFRREARAAASLRHPAVATVYALEERDGRFYLVTEYLPGGRLGAEIADGGLPLDEAVRVVRQIGEGLAEAHANGVVHRDLKPDNIIRDSNGRPKLVDFGLALVSGNASKDASGDGSDDLRSGPASADNLTRTGFMLGTPGYISPEQLEGEPADFRSDQFAMGVLLLELITGQNPFHRSTVAATAGAILHDRAVIPEHVPSPVARIVERCLEKDPEKRFRSTADLAAELRDAEAGIARHSRVARSERPGTNVTRKTTGPSLASFWWAFHQTAVLILYGVMIPVAWSAFEATEGVWGSRVIFFGILCASIGNGTLRTHLLFTSRFNRPAMADQLRRTRPWMVGVDTVFSGALVVGAIRTMAVTPLWASVLAAVGVSYAIVFYFVEPSTTRAIFPPTR